MTGGYRGIAELPSDGATGVQISMLYTRYQLAARLAQDGEVLEVACGPGVGLRYLAARARRVIGGDSDGGFLKLSRRHYGAHIPLACLDAHALPFRQSSFDVVILFEAIYYLQEVERFLEEARRVLRSGGALLICSANKERHGFEPSPLTVSYFSASELRRLLTHHGLVVELFAAFPVAPVIRRNTRGAARALANVIRLSPEAKATAKRLLFGKPLSFPAEVTDEMAEEADLVPIVDDLPVTDFQVLYAIGHMP